DRYSAEGQYDRFPEIARQVVATRPDVIFAVAMGIVQSLARPGGNITGVSTDAGAEIYGKKVELLVQAVGKLSNARLLTSAANTQSPGGKAVIDAFEKMKIPYQLERLQSPINEVEYRRAFDAMRRDRVDGVVIGGDVENYTYRSVLGRLAQEYR